MGRFGRRGRESRAGLLISCALATAGLSACADIWGFDDLRGTRDGGPANPGVTSVGVGADAGSGGAGGGGGSGSDAQVSTGGVGGGVDAGASDGGALADGRGAEGGQRDAPGPIIPDASRDVTMEASSVVGAQDAARRDTAGDANLDASRDASVDTPSPTPVAISIDFVGGGIPMALSETAGVFPAAQWNSAAGAAGTLSALVQSDGSATIAAVTWDGGGVWQIPVPDAPGNTRMMTGYLDPRTTSTVVVSGLPASLLPPPAMTCTSIPTATSPPASPAPRALRRWHDPASRDSTRVDAIFRHVH